MGVIDKLVIRRLEKQLKRSVALSDALRDEMDRERASALRQLLIAWEYSLDLVPQLFARLQVPVRQPIERETILAEIDKLNAANAAASETPLPANEPNDG